MTTDRLDAALTARGLARSRTQAQALLRDGCVLVDGTVVTKAATRVRPEARLEVVTDDVGGESAWIARGWVGRGALKLEHALRGWEPQGLDVADRSCLDVGASTGGFTEVLLAHGARRVVALDVGHGQLDPRVRADPRVLDLPGTNIRDVSPEDLGGPVGVVVCDVSFISLRLVVPLLRRLCTDDAEIVLLVKPQFEVGRAGLGHGGVVRSAVTRARALGEVLRSVDRAGLAVGGVERSPVVGGSGNIEYLLWLRVRRTGMIGWGLDPEELALRRRDLSQEEER
ncbi:TlyA family RNA methyltransferase [Ornithinimicrobium avium]|uniref:TlyA family RNA methyltransferase n=1 Tax=Ornithinimicrobium avium TaxID=2283195 RepID=A0A345NJ54_9MICO|nr:TlyA family RNA methyltransferase [Ornithinimicrobium avium]AXH95062.1 TlyA family RNA methyltransferase [Ornithinimicrobium avium]